jgi:hypothetical protein
MQHAFVDRYWSILGGGVVTSEYIHRWAVLASAATAAAGIGGTGMAGVWHTSGM